MCYAHVFVGLFAGEEPEVVLRQFGEYFFRFCKRSGYDCMLRALGGNLFEFTENLDALHSYLSLSYKVPAATQIHWFFFDSNLKRKLWFIVWLLQEMNAPSFRVENNLDGTLLLHYYSDRRGLCHIVPGNYKNNFSNKSKFYLWAVVLLSYLCHYLINVRINGQLLSSLSSTGIIGAVAKDFFHVEITMEIVNQLEELERTGKKEHVVFLVTQRPAGAAPSCVVSHKTEPLLRTQCLQSLANQRNAVRRIKEVSQLYI